MAILEVHELGHYFTARRRGMRVTPPYFIPVFFVRGRLEPPSRSGRPPLEAGALAGA